MEANSEDVALQFDSSTHLYGELKLKIEEYSHNLVKEIPKKAVVAILSDYCFESIALFFALTANENIIVPIITTSEKEVEEKLQESRADFVLQLSDETYTINQIERLAEVKHDYITAITNENHAGLVLFSSGSTGKPKAMIHDLDQLLGSFKNKKKKRLNFMVFLMFDHIGGLNTLFNCLSMGVKIIIPNSRRAENVCSLIEEYKVHILPTSPTFLNLMIIGNCFEKFDLSSLKMITYGTEPMQESLLVKLKEKLPRVKFLQTFGTSETGIAQISSKSSTSTLIKIDDPNLEYKIVNGELWLRSKTQILGYLNASMEQFTEDKWFMTGDIVEQYEDNYLKVVGRSKEVINVGGEKVLPVEIESELMKLEFIYDCLAYSVKNAITGQSVGVSVAVDESLSAKDVKTLIRKHFKSNLAPYKVPTKIKVLEKIQFGERFKKNRIVNEHN